MFSPHTFANVINSYLPEPHASLLNGIILGVNLKTTKLFYQQLKEAGLLHLVVLSGMNISLLAGFIALSTLWLGRKISALLTILFIIFFVVFVGAQAPIIRAAIMAILTLVAILYGRKNIALYSLFLSGFLIALFQPSWLRTISFQLSFAATLGLILFGRGTLLGTATKFSNQFIYKFINYLREEFRISLAAQIFTAPIIFIYFHQISLVSPLTNVLVSWTVAPLMIFGFLTVFLGLIFYPLGIIPSYICYGILSYIIWIVENITKIPSGFMDFK